MSDRLRNNLVAGFIVAAFWIIWVLPVMADPIVTESTSNSTVTSDTTTKTTIRTNPPSAISPSINASNSDLCTVGVSGAVQTQILGISTGQAYRDANCERLKIAKVLYDMGMKVAAVSVMCADFRVYDAMMKAISIIKGGVKLGNIGETIQTYVEKKGFSVVRDYCGHGIGTTFHEQPNILHYGNKDEGIELQPGMLFTVEPMINEGTYHTKLLKDNWTAVTKDKSLSAQFEHTVGVTKDGFEIFTKSKKKYDQPPYTK